MALTTGRRTECFAMGELPDLAPARFVEMGDFLKAALDTVLEVDIRDVVTAGMVGKLTEMAQGATMIHAGKGAVDTAQLAELAAQVDAPADAIA